MVRVIEIKGDYSVFTLVDGTTLRLLPFSEQTVDSANISDELKNAETMKMVKFAPAKVTETKSSKSNKGGSK